MVVLEEVGGWGSLSGLGGLCSRLVVVDEVKIGKVRTVVVVEEVTVDKVGW